MANGSGTEAVVSTSKTAITDRMLHEVIRAGVGAQVLAETTRAFYADSAKAIPDDAKRYAHAEREARKLLQDPISGDPFKERIEDRVDRYIAWIRESQHEKEGFWKKVGIHATASVTLTVSLIVLLIIAGVVNKISSHSRPVSVAAHGVKEILETAFPEVGGEGPSSATSSASPPAAAPTPPNVSKQAKTKPHDDTSPN